MLGWAGHCRRSVLMASSSSSLTTRPFLLARQLHQEAGMAASLSPSNRRLNGGVEQKQDLLIQTWAQMVSCCGVDWGCVPQLWNWVVLRKWLNIGSGLGDSDFSADECGTSDGETHSEDGRGWEHKLSDEERILGGLGASTAGNQIKGVTCRLRRYKSEILRSQYTDVKELRICAATWNVGGKFPSSDLDIREWLDTEEPADIYVFGFQEIVPLNAGNIFGAEDNRPVAVWEHIIRETLNKICPEKSRFKCQSDPHSPTFDPSDYVLAMEDDLLSESDNDSDQELHPLIKKDSTGVNRSGVNEKRYKCDTSIPTNQKNMRMLNHAERPGKIRPEQPLDVLLGGPQDNAESSTSEKAPTSSASSKSTDENFNDFPEGDLACDVNISDRIKGKRPEFVRIISKQMVGIFHSIWVRRSLRKHIQNLRVSTVGVGAMGYIGNKGSISVSMSIYQTRFCFVCCHLAAGEKDGDELKRNSNVEEIIRKTVFNLDPVLGMPMRIHDHERIIWLGDLNYRVNLSYEKTHELISKQDWDALFEKDQLKRKLEKGCTFDGWVEGVISFPPTYKYEFDSENYVSDESKSGRRTPAWCDRILSYGKGIRLLSYKRGELTLSDHRPVIAAFMVEVEVFRRRKLQGLTFTDAQVEHHQ